MTTPNNQSETPEPDPLDEEATEIDANSPEAPEQIGSCKKTPNRSEVMSSREHVHADQWASRRCGERRSGALFGRVPTGGTGTLAARLGGLLSERSRTE